MPKTSAPPLLRVFSVLLSVSASVTLYHLEISLRLFWSRRSRRCVQAPLGVDESVLMSHSLAAPGNCLPARESHRWGKCLWKRGARLETVPALKKKTPQPAVFKTILPNAHYLYSGVFFIPWKPWISVPHDSINIFIDHVCLHCVVFYLFID